MPRGCISVNTSVRRLQAREASRVAALLQQQAIKDAQLEAASRQRQHENSKRVLERSVDLADKRDKVCFLSP